MPETNVDAARRTIAELDREGKITEVDALLVTNVLTLAEAVDANPSRAILRKEYREAATALRRAHDGDSDAVADLLERLRAPVGDTATPGAADAGRPSRPDRPRTRPAADAVAANGGRRRPRAAPERPASV